MSMDPSTPAPGQAIIDDFDLEPDEPAGDRAGPAPGGLSARFRVPRPSLRELLVLPLLKQALGRDLVRRLRRRDSTLALVITAPSPAWVAPLSAALTVAFPELRLISPSERLHRADEQARRAEEVAGALAKGISLAGIAADPARELSRVLLGAADAHVTVLAPGAALVERAIRAFSRTGKAVTLPARDLIGLDYPDFAAAFRPGSPRPAIADRLARAAAARSSVSFADDAPTLAVLSGYGPAHAWAEDLVREVEERRAGRASGAALESALLYGLPGTGKTLLARAVSNAAGLPLVVTSVASWFAASDGHLGAVLKEQSRFFASLRATRPCVGFLDEVDALPSRANLSGSRNADFWTPVITGFLLGIDAIRQSCPDIVLIGATNFVKGVDPALRRPGRLDRAFEIAPPDVDGLVGILRAHLKDELTDADLTPVAQLLLGRVGADVVQVVDGARRQARRAGRELSLADLLAAATPPDPRSAAELRACAVHEAGHAVVAVLLGRTLAGVSLQLAGLSGGRTRIERPPLIPTRAAIEDMVVIGLAGRAADLVLGAGASAGAVSDLATATRELAALHVSFGLGKSLVHQAAAEDAGALVRRDPRLARSVEADLTRLLRRAISLVTAHRSAVIAVAEALLAHRVLSGAQVQSLLKDHPPSAPESDIATGPSAATGPGKSIDPSSETFTASA